MPLNAVARLIIGVTSPYAAMLSDPRNLPIIIPSITMPSIVAIAAAIILITELRNSLLIIFPLFFILSSLLSYSRFFFILKIF